jgi:hypothetical protein
MNGRCGTCARFVRVREEIDHNGEVRRAGDCLLEVWPAPLYEDRTCNQYVAKGAFQATLANRKPVRASKNTFGGGRGVRRDDLIEVELPLTLPEDIVAMDAEEFRSVLKRVLQEELALSTVELSPRFRGGELVIVPGKEGTQEKRISLESFFHKIVMLRDRLRVLEQKVNGNDKLTDEEKVQMQQYVTQCYGTLTTFNILFADKEDGFVGQKSGE